MPSSDRSVPSDRPSTHGPANGLETGALGTRALGTDGIVEAAGGVVLDLTSTPPNVLVVHRPEYADWSLPKGHIDAGEGPAAAALREVLEETGVQARIVAPAGITEYRIGTVHKRVHWFVMFPEDPSASSDREPDEEVDEVAWWPLPIADERLTHLSDRVLVLRTAELVP